MNSRSDDRAPVTAHAVALPEYVEAREPATHPRPAVQADPYGFDETPQADLAFDRELAQEDRE